MTTSLLIVDDHDALRRSLCELIRSNHPDVCCLEAGSGEVAVELAAVHRPKVVLMDLSLPGISGIEATRSIKAVSPASSIVVVTIFDTAAHRADAVAAGATAYVPKIDLGGRLTPILAQLLADEADGSGKASAEHAKGSLQQAEFGDVR